MFDVHLDYNPIRTANKENNPYGYTTKTLKGDHDENAIYTLRNCNANFEPQLIRTNQTHITDMDDQILCLHVKGMNTRNLVAAFADV